LTTSKRQVLPAIYGHDGGAGTRKTDARPETCGEEQLKHTATGLVPVVFRLLHNSPDSRVGVENDPPVRNAEGGGTAIRLRRASISFLKCDTLIRPVGEFQHRRHGHYRQPLTGSIPLNLADMTVACCGKV